MKKIYSFAIIILCVLNLGAQSRIYPPTLKAPADLATGQMPNVLLNWFAVTGESTEISYEVQLSQSSDFADAITFPRTDLTALEMSDLNFGVLYYWRVKAFDGDTPSEWSQVWSFTVISSVILKTPANGAMVYSNPLITWTAITGLKNYQMQIDTSYEWKLMPSGTSSDIYSAYIITENDMWAVGEGGLILRFNGTVWSPVESGTTQTLYGVNFTDANNGYAVGAGGTILHFDGTTWTGIDAGVTEDLRGVDFADANKGWVVGNGGLILKYADNVWSQETTDNSKDLYGVSVINSSDVWACGKTKIVVHFDGNTWTTTEVGTKDLTSICFIEPNAGWVVGKGGTIFMYDGNQWIAETSGTTKDLNGVSFDGTTGYAVGKTGTLLIYDGVWSAGNGVVTKDLNTVSAFDGLGILGGTDGSLVGKAGGGFDSPYVKKYNISKDSVSYRLKNLLFGQTFYYRMRAINNLDTSNWSGAKSITSYSSPELSSPSNGTTGTNLTQVYEWEKYDGVVDYYFQVSDNAEFTNPFEGISDSTSILYTVQLFNHEYFWRVSTANPFDHSDWSEAWTFTTTNTVELELPANESAEVNVCPKYQWVEIDGAAEYELWVDKSPEFGSASMMVVNVPYFQCQTGLEKNTIYFWKVRAYSSLDTTDWSNTWSFKTEGYIGIDEQSENGVLSIYPNPSNGKFSVDLLCSSFGVCQLKVVDLTGRSVFENTYTFNPGNNKIELNLSDIENGVYMINIKRENEIMTRKLFIR